MESVRLAELCASTALFTDLGTGQPVENSLRTTLVAMRLADALSVDSETRRDVYYVSLLRFLGCTADAHVVAQLGDGDEIRILSGAAPTYMGSPREATSQMIRVVAAGAAPPGRLRAIARLLTDPKGGEKLMSAHCEVASRLAREMRLPPSVSDALDVAYARWDGKGVPAGVGGTDIPLSVRVAIVARDTEIWSRDVGADAALRVLQERRERAYDPALVDAVRQLGVGHLRAFEGDLWAMVLDAEPEPVVSISASDLGQALAAMGDFADLKVPALTGHSRRVADLVSAAAVDRRHSDEEKRVLGRAALIHDLGMVAVPVGVQQANTLTPAEVEQMRMHPIWSQRILSRCSGLAEAGRLAGRHHEHLNGSGYPAGVSGDGAGGACLLACAETYDELVHPGRGRAALSPTQAAEELNSLARDGCLDIGDVRAVLDAAGVAAPLTEIERPAGLTEREVDVLSLLALGKSNRQIAATLGISPKTVGSHVEHIYAKAGVTTRAAATLFAAQNRLV